MPSLHSCLAALLIATVAAVPGMPAEAASPVPACRLETDRALAVQVRGAIERALAAYRVMGIALPIDAVGINGATAGSPGVERGRTLVVQIVRDAARDKVDRQGCTSATGPVARGEMLDASSVRGVCVVVAVEVPEVRCSAASLALFARVGQRIDRANPALLYVLAHELAHLHQRRVGEYTGRTETIDLAAPVPRKIEALRSACEPGSTRIEAEADALALRVLAEQLTRPPYRETVFSEQGSLYWNIDQMVLAVDAWQQASQDSEAVSQPRLHAAFLPTEFPSPKAVIERNAKLFVCDVIDKRQGQLQYPGKSLTHPPLDQRLRRVAEALKPIAERLPRSGAQQDFAPVARLQQDLGPIFTHIWRETGVYLEALQDRVCTLVNAPSPAAVCR